MDYSKKWEIIKYIGSGGQGKVHQVIKLEDVRRIETDIMDSLRRLTGISPNNKDSKNNYKKFCNALFDLFKTQDPSQQGALKVLHEPEHSRDADLSYERMKREIAAMSQNLHPNLIRILEADPDFKWYVSEYYPNGTLDKQREMFKGNLPKALKTFRSLVEAVAKLHKEGYTHRDIKPQNVFLNIKNELVLGDFGLIHFEGGQHKRISQTYENVGSRDWMPPWAMGQRIEEVKPAFDVYCLGKLFWSMLTGKHFLNLWYFDREGNNVEKLFPNSSHMRLANELFKNCIVEEEKNCLVNANVLLDKIDATISILDLNADVIDSDVKRPCKVCGLGRYNLEADSSPNKIRNFGFNTVGSRTMKIFACSHCGHVQIFSYLEEALPDAWKKSNN